MFIACVDVFTGFVSHDRGGLSTDTCPIVHGASDAQLVALRVASDAPCASVATNLKVIYSARSLAEAEFNLDLLALEMGCALPNQKPRPGVADFWRVIPLCAEPSDIRHP
jgi:hypothetical protein